MTDGPPRRPRFVIPTPAGPVDILSLTRRPASDRARSAVLRSQSYEPLAMTPRYRAFTADTGPLGLAGLGEAAFVLQLARDIDGGDSWNLPVLLFHLHEADHGGLAAALAAGGVSAVFATGSFAFDPGVPLERQGFRAERYALDEKVASFLATAPETGTVRALLPASADAGDLDRAEARFRAAIPPARLAVTRCTSVGDALVALRPAAGTPRRLAGTPAPRRGAVLVPALAIAAMLAVAGGAAAYLTGAVGSAPSAADGSAVPEAAARGLAVAAVDPAPADGGPAPQASKTPPEAETVAFDGPRPAVGPAPRRAEPPADAVRPRWRVGADPTAAPEGERPAVATAPPTDAASSPGGTSPDSAGTPAPALPEGTTSEVPVGGVTPAPEPAAAEAGPPAVQPESTVPAPHGAGVAGAAAADPAATGEAVDPAAPETAAPATGGSTAEPGAAPTSVAAVHLAALMPPPGLDCRALFFEQAAAVETELDAAAEGLVLPAGTCGLLVTAPRTVPVAFAPEIVRELRGIGGRPLADPDGVTRSWRGLAPMSVDIGGRRLGLSGGEGEPVMVGWR